MGTCSDKVREGKKRVMEIAAVISALGSNHLPGASRGASSLPFPFFNDKISFSPGLIKVFLFSHL